MVSLKFTNATALNVQVLELRVLLDASGAQLSCYFPFPIKILLSMFSRSLPVQHERSYDNNLPVHKSKNVL